MAEYENDTIVEEEGSGPTGFPIHVQLYIVTGLQAGVIIFGIPGNTLVLYLYGKRGERLTYITGILALAVKDLTSCCLLLPCHIIMEAYGFMTTSDAFCKLYHLLLNIELPMMFLFLVLLGMDRCVCVFRSHIQSIYNRRVLIGVAAVTVISVAIGIVPTLGFGVYERANGNIIMRGYCHFNQLIISLKMIIAFAVFIRVGVLLIPTLIIAVMYGSIFGVYLFRKYSSSQAVSASPLDGAVDNSGRLGGSDVSEVSGSPPGPQEGASSVDENEGRDLAELQQEQLGVTALFFAVTVTFYVLMLPALLMASKLIQGNYILWNLYQLHYMSNPFVYLCMDSVFRKGVTGLFISSWSRLIN